MESDPQSLDISKQNSRHNYYKVRKVLVIGEMGAGKSSFCQSISGD